MTDSVQGGAGRKLVQKVTSLNRIPSENNYHHEGSSRNNTYGNLASMPSPHSGVDTSKLNNRIPENFELPKINAQSRPSV